MKKFQAKSMAEAMKMVKVELGPNAIILHTRDLGKGLLGFFFGRGVEVTAAVDLKNEKNTAQKPKSKPPTSNKKAPHSRNVGSSIDYQVDDNMPPNNKEDNPLLALSKKLQEEKRQELANNLKQIPGMPDLLKSQDSTNPKKQETPPQNQPAPRTPSSNDNKNNKLEQRLEKMETHLKHLSGLLENLTPSLLSGGNQSIVPNRTRDLYNHLLEQDVDESLALTIATQIAEITDENDDIWTALKSYLINKIPVAAPVEIDPKVKKPKLIMLVGPTGVGKTTTIAKISAKYRYNPKTDYKTKLAFITADLYRLAAVEQLQKYSEILGVDIEVTYSPDEVREALKKHKSDHLLLFDTAGTCQRNMPQMSTLSSIVEASEPTEVHLVVSTTTKFGDMIDIIEHFKEIKPTHLIFSKIDESTTFGAMLNTIMKFNIPVSYLTTGQNVPEDIEIAKPERMAKLLLQKPTVNRSIGTIEPDVDSSSGQSPSPSSTTDENNQSQTDTNQSKSDKNDETKNS